MDWHMSAQSLWQHYEPVHWSDGLLRREQLHGSMGWYHSWRLHLYLSHCEDADASYGELSYTYSACTLHLPCKAGLSWYCSTCTLPIPTYIKVSIDCCGSLEQAYDAVRPNPEGNLGPNTARPCRPHTRIRQSVDFSMYMSAMLLTCMSIWHDYQRQQHLESMTATLQEAERVRFDVDLLERMITYACMAVGEAHEVALTIHYLTAYTTLDTHIKISLCNPFVLTFTSVRM
jgi:hypothetical protein